MHQLNQKVTGIGYWNTESAFRSYSTFIHEVTHYLQDISTGLGHWDYISSNAYVPAILGQGRFCMFTKRKLGLDNIPSLAISLEDVNNDMMFVPEAELSFSRRMNLLSKLQEYDQSLTLGDEIDYLTHSFLEAEAVAVTYLEWLDCTHASSVSQEIAMQNRHLVVPWGMPDVYRQLILNVGQIFLAPFFERKGLGGSHETAIIQAFFVIFLHLIDIASACPPSSLVTENGLTKDDYEPGLRFVRLARAFQQLPDSMDSEIIEVLIRSDLLRLEQILSEYMDQAYVSYKSAYSAWVDEFRRIAENSDDRIVKLRLKASEVRLSKPGIFIRKNPASFLEHKLRLQLISSGQYIAYGFSFEDLEPYENTTFFIDLMRHNRDQALADHFLRSNPFICPLAESHFCKIKEEGCHSIQDIDQLPVSPECSVRLGLSEASFFE